MKLAVVAAGFTPGEADQLRKAMGAWRRQGVIEQFHQKLVQGMANNGYDSDFAERVFKQIQGFGEYGFPESHAASFALLVYVSAWLKHRYPAAFTAALLNSQPMGFYGPSQLVGDARKHGVPVLPVDVCSSNWDCTLEQTPDGHFALRLGFRMIKGISAPSVSQLCDSRTTQMFQSFEDFRHRTRLSSSVLAKLSEADAFRSLKMNRRQALWNSLPDQEEQPLYDGQNTDTAVHLPAMPPHEQVLADYKTVGLSLKGHPLKTYRSALQAQGVTPAEQLTPQRHGSRVRVAGLVLIRQHPGSANGVTFVTLEDETGTINLIIRPDVWNRYRTIARTAAVLIARGQLQHQHNVIHVLVDQLAELTTTNHNISVKSRDFR
jgi:error-prone DNA polymerase